MRSLERTLESLFEIPTRYDLPVCAYCDENLDPDLGAAFEAGVGPVCWDQSRVAPSDTEDPEVHRIVRRMSGIRRSQRETDVFLRPDFRVARRRAGA